MRAEPRNLVIMLTAFLTLIDLFASQPILPMLAVKYGVAPGQIGAAANASTLGMALASLGVGLWGARLGRRRGVATALALLALPTLGLAVAPNLAVFAALRITQGLCMATAFSLTMAYLGESFCGSRTATALGAYVTGNVGANLFGRLIAAAAAQHLGLAGNFCLLAGLNLAGAILVGLSMRDTMRHDMQAGDGMAVAPGMASLWAHLRNPRLRAAFAIGFCLLFAFIGAFTYINFVLSRPPLSLGMMALGFAYVVFAPSLLTTPRAGALVARLGSARAMAASLLLALLSLPLLAVPALPPVLAGMVLLACGTFLAQAIATGFVGREAAFARSAASGLYLAAYFSGGLTGSALLGAIFDHAGWNACLGVIAIALLAALALARHLHTSSDPARPAS